MTSDEDGGALGGDGDTVESLAALIEATAPMLGGGARAVAEGFLRGQHAWPTAVLDAGRFAGFVATQVTAGPGDGAPTVAALRWDDLFLAAACADGDAGAIVAFEDAFFDEVEVAFSPRSHDRAFLDDVRQNLRERLFVGHAGRAPSIVTYGGRGSLRRWFRLLVVHDTLNWMRAEARAPVPNGVDAEASLVSPSDPELVYLRERYSTDFRAATEDAVQRLLPDERRMLQHHYVEQLSIDRIGAVYGVHRVTAARRVNRARDRFVALVRQALTARLRVADHELVSILRLLPTQFSMSFRRVLASV